MTNGRIAGFDGIRGIAALSIVFRHAGGLSLLTSLGLGVVAPLVTTGVPWFYVLSGFLITTLLLREQQATGGIALGRFYMRRILRLYPVLLVCLLLVGLLSLLDVRDVSPVSWVYAAVYLYNYIPISLHDDWLGSFHTLATEEQFYLVFPILMLLFRRRPMLLAAGLAAYIALVPSLLYWFSTHYAWSQDYFPSRWSVFSGYDLAAGCVAALALHRFPAWFQRHRQALALAGGALFMSMLFTTTVPTVAIWTTSIGLACLVVAVALSPDALAVRVLETRPLQYLGRVSYGVYVWQSFYITTGPETVGHWPLDAPWNLVLLAVTVPLSWTYIEQPFLRLKERFTPRLYRNV